MYSIAMDLAQDLRTCAAQGLLTPVRQPASTSDRVGYGLDLALQIPPFLALRSSGAKDAGRLHERLSKLWWQGGMVQRSQ